jgi:hypothetical protein
MRITFKPEYAKTKKGKLFVKLAQECGEDIIPFTDEEIKEMCYSDYVCSDYAIHDASDFQLQVFIDKIIKYPKDLLNYEYDIEDLQKYGRSSIERDVQSSLTEHKTAEVKPTGLLYHHDISDKINAQMMLPKIGVPVVDKAKIGEPAFIKHARGDKSSKVYYVDSFKRHGKNYVAQKKIESLLEYPYCVRINMDFEKITAACIRIDKKSSKILNVDSSRLVTLPLYGFEKGDKEIYEKLGIKDKIPDELIDYSIKIGEFCSKQGIQSIGIDYMKDKDKWVCLGDINTAPGRGIYYQLMHELGKKGYELSHENWRKKDQKEYYNIREKAIIHFVKDSFKKWLNKY